MHKERRSNYAFKPIAGQSLRPNQTIVPQRLNAALDPACNLRTIDVIDTKARSKLAQATRALVNGKITNDQFEDRIPDSLDPAVSGIYSDGLWVLYGDLSEHKLIGSKRLSEKQRNFALRCILFLKSGQEYPWPRKPLLLSILNLVLGIATLGLIPYLIRDDEKKEYWPFMSKSEFQGALKQPVYLRGGV